MTDDPVVIAGRYRLLHALASGGMGVVWKGWDERLDRPVAIKQLHVQSGLPQAEASIARDRAMREARNTAKLHHPNSVPVYDVVEHDREPCLIMQFLPSVSLQEAIKQRGPLAVGEAARIGSEIAAALGAAHQAGIVHRDVKPGNILLAHDGTAKLTDYGISHAVGDVALTATGMLTGTPAYLAPEVARGQSASFAADVYSLGATLYTATEGRSPFDDDDNAMAVLHKVASGQLRAPERSAALTPLLLRMLALDPLERPTVAEAGAALAELAGAPAAPAPVPAPAAEHSTTRLPALGGRRSRWGWFAAAALAALIGIVALVALGDQYSGRQRASAASRRPSAAASTRAPAAPQTHAAIAAPAPSAASSSVGTAPTTAAQLAKAITDYYALIPGNLQQGWDRLTPAYQANHAGGFSGYQSFWSQFQRVAVSQVSASPPSSVTATITYVFTDGHSTVEQTQFELVPVNGQWKIDKTSVLSSR